MRKTALSVLLVFAFAILVAQPVNAAIATKTWGASMFWLDREMIELDEGLGGDNQHMFKASFDLLFEGGAEVDDNNMAMQAIIDQTKEALWDKEQTPVYIKVSLENRRCYRYGIGGIRCSYEGTVEAHLYTPETLFVISSATIIAILAALATLLELGLAKIIVATIIGIVAWRVLDIVGGGGEGPFGLNTNFLMLVVGGVVLAVVVLRRKRR